MHPKQYIYQALCLMLTLSTTPIFSLAAPVVQIVQAPKILEEIVVTANRNEQTIADTSTNIAKLVNLEDIGQTHINEAMQRFSGVWISRGNGQEHLTAIRSPVLTGAGGCGAFLMAQDGIPLRASGFCNVNELFDANTEQAGGIEVIKGPGSVLYGSNALHGTINVLTPKLNGKQSVQVEAGPHEYYRVKTTLGSNLWRLDANGTSDGGYKDNSGFDQQKLSFKAKTNIAGFDTNFVFSATNLNQETAGFIRGDKVYKDDSVRKSNPNPEAYRDSESIRLYAQMHKQLSADTRLRITPYVRRTRMQFLQHFLPGQALEKNGQESIGIQSALYFNKWTIGADIEATDAFLKETQPLATTGSPFLVATIPAGDHYNYDVKARTLAAFAQYKTDLGDKTRIQFGLRFEQVRYKYNNKMLSGRTRDDGTVCGFGGCRFSRPADRTDTFNNFSPRLGLSHFINDNNQAYIQFARGFRAPQATELYRLQASQSVNNIDSEALDSIELGFRGNLAKIQYDVSLFSMRKDNFIFRDTTRTTVDNGKTSHQGIEISASGKITDVVSADFVFSYAKHQYENNPALSRSPIKGNDIDTAPRKTGSARINWQVNDAMHTEFEVIYMGKYFEDPENLNEYEGHTLANIRAKYTLSPQLQTFVRITNLFDTDYAERADFSFGSDRYFVGEPRSFYAGINYQF